jgi:hypothetical protein
MTDNVMAWSHPAGKILDSYATVTETVGNPLADTAFQKATVPTGKRWLLYGGSVKHDDSVAHGMTIRIYDENDKEIFILIADDGGAANGQVNFPIAAPYNVCEIGIGAGIFPVPMKAGWYVQIDATANMTDASVKWERNYIVLEVAVSQ